jgi:Tol biopolymer transport system component
VNFGSLPDGQCDRSADGSKLAFTYQTGDQEGRLTGSSLRWLDLRDVTAVYEPSPELRVINRVAWSPVGEQIAFSTCREDQGGCGLYLYDLPPGEVRLLTGAASTIWDVIWKPDGAQLAFVSTVGNIYTLFVVDAANGEVVYQGGFDLAAWRPASNAPINDWGVSIPRGYSGSRCFTDGQAATPEANER